MRLVADRDGPLLHRLEQRALRAGGGAVDLVRQDQPAEQRAGWNTSWGPWSAPSTSTTVPVMSAGIRSGVNWMRLCADAERARECAHHARLADAGHALEQRVTTQDEADHHAADGLALSHDRGADLRLDRRDGRAEGGVAGCGWLIGLRASELPR